MTGTAEPGSEARSQHEPVFALLRRLVAVLLAGSYEGTFRAEQIVQRVARSYGADVEVAFNADSAALTVGERTATFAAVPLVPPLDQVSDFRSLIYDIEDGRLTASQAHE
ncbi:MAG TPA: hypothetical protein VH834_21065, partial [Solirubrobacteraceae bacterium]